MAKNTPNIRPNYIEMKASNIEASKAFYSAAFGFKFTDYGTEYSCVEANGNSADSISIGIAAGQEPAAPMPTFESDDLEDSLAAVQKAGAQIVKDIFAFPGGRRFECLDPSSNRIAIYQND